MDMQVNSVIQGAGADDRRAISVTSRAQLDFLIKEFEVESGVNGRRFHLERDFGHSYLVRIAGHGYDVRRFSGSTPSGPAEFMTPDEVDAFLSARVLRTWPTAHPEQHR